MSETNNEFNPGGYVITKADLYTYDQDFLREKSEPSASLLGFIDVIEFTQGLNGVSYNGNIHVYDKKGYLENLPLRAQEVLHLEITTTDTKTKVSLVLFIHSIDGITPDTTTKGVGYDLKVVSYSSFEASKRKITEAFKKPANSIALELFRKYVYNRDFNIGSPIRVDEDGETLPYATTRYPVKYLVDKSFWIQPTVGILEMIVPNMRTQEAFQLLSKMSWAGESSPSQSFRFFETWDGYYFVTDEFLTQLQKDKPYRLFYAPGTGSADPKNPANQLNRIEDLKVLTSGRNTAANMSNGAYKSKVMEIDLVRGVVTDRKFDYLKDGKYKGMDGEEKSAKNLPQTEDFINDTYTFENSLDMIVFKNYSGTGDIPGALRGDAFIPEIAQNRIAYNSHLNTITLAVKMKGRADLKPGQIATLDIQNLDGSEELRNNPQLSGRYLITRANHMFDQGTLRTTLSLSKYDWSK